jgi:hypothetical protein
MCYELRQALYTVLFAHIYETVFVGITGRRVRQVKESIRLWRWYWKTFYRSVPVDFILDYYRSLHIRPCRPIVSCFRISLCTSTVYLWTNTRTCLPSVTFNTILLETVRAGLFLLLCVRVCTCVCVWHVCVYAAVDLYDRPIWLVPILFWRIRRLSPLQYSVRFLAAGRNYLSSRVSVNFWRL